LWFVCLGWSGLCALVTFAADEPATRETRPPAKKGELVPLNKAGTVLLDKPGGRVVLKTTVALREGTLEMFCCPKQTKEHESILSVDSKAYVIHAALLALGATPGTPVQFDPKYKPPTGQKIDIFVNWDDEKGKPHRARAQTWIRHATRRFYGEPLATLPAGIKIPKGSELRYDSKLKELSWYGTMTPSQKEELFGLSNDKRYRRAIQSFFDRSQPRQMEADWVFAGSGFYVDEETGKKFYLAEDGDLICVANFPSAMIDVAVESSAGTEGLLFESYTERIPPKGTAVTVELIPVLDKKEK
jgi:hypothetical protein